MWWFFRIILSSFFLLSIVLSIPISFDVGGRDSGLAYSLSLFTFYIFYSAVKLATPETSRVRWTISKLIQTAQWVVIPSLLIWSLHRFAVDANSTDWVSRTLGGAPVTKHDNWTDYFWGTGGLVENVALGGWDKSLRYSSPVFQLLEGFCTLLVIQAAGQITKWLVNRGHGDTWVVRAPSFLPTPSRSPQPADVTNISDSSSSSSSLHLLLPAPSISCGGLPCFRPSATSMPR